MRNNLLNIFYYLCRRIYRNYQSHGYNPVPTTIYKCDLLINPHPPVKTIFFIYYENIKKRKIIITDMKYYNFFDAKTI